MVALTPEELSTLVRVVPQRAEHGSGSGEESVLTGGRGELAHARAEDEAPLEVTCDEAVVLERDRKAVSRGARKTGRRDELGQG